MAEKDLGFTTGAAATRAVKDDPFWATVVRRHGDVDVVVLPPEAPPRVEVPADEPVVDVDTSRDGLRAGMASFWTALGLTGEPGHLDDTWFAGPVPGTLRWQGTASFDDLDPVTASRLLERAAELLDESAGWRVLTPDDGVPRVLAGRPGRLGREEVQVLLPSPSRVVLRMRSDLVLVGRDAAAAAIGSAEGSER